MNKNIFIFLAFFKRKQNTYKKIKAININKANRHLYIFKNVVHFTEAFTRFSRELKSLFSIHVLNVLNAKTKLGRKYHIKKALFHNLSVECWWCKTYQIKNEKREKDGGCLSKSFLEMKESIA